MDLQNSAQGKAFAADSYATTRPVTTREFVVEPSRKEKSFVDARTVAVQEYHSRSVRSDSPNSVVPQNCVASLPGQLATPLAPGVRQTRDAQLKVATQEFAGQREFREQGKSQKSLDHQNPPLTIDQVRQLLNKNK